MKINDEYVAYCFDEAVAEFIYCIDNNEKPRYKSESNNENGNPGLKLLMS